MPSEEQIFCLGCQLSRYSWGLASQVNRANEYFYLTQAYVICPPASEPATVCFVAASSKWLRCGFSNTTFESSRFESCSHYEKDIVKHFHGKLVISWAMIAWSFKKHRFPKQFWQFFTRKWFRRDKYATCGLRVTLQYHSRTNLSPFTKDFRVWETPIESAVVKNYFLPWSSTRVFHSNRTNLSPFTKDFRVWETLIEILSFIWSFSEKPTITYQ